jgi:hypothetical protein
MPKEGSPEWLGLGKHLVSIAQSHHLGLRPWQSPPLVVAETGANTQDEYALCQTMRDLNISICEPDPPSAIDAAMQRRDATRMRRQAKSR